jgi:hypothetical protein
VSLVVLLQAAADRRLVHIEGPLAAADRHSVHIAAAADKRDTVILTVDMVMVGDIVTSLRSPYIGLKTCL